MRCAAPPAPLRRLPGGWGVACGLAWALLAGGCEKEALPPVAPLSASALPEVALSVRAEPVKQGTLAASTTRTALLEPWQATVIAAEAAGTVVMRRVDDGQDVRAGEVLLRLDPSRQQIAVDAAKVALQAAQTDLGFLDKEARRKRGLFAKSAISSLEVDAAEHQVARARSQVAQAEVQVRQAERALADCTVRAPHDGVVGRRQVDVGDQVAPGRPLLDLVDLSRLRLRVGIPGPELGGLEPGQEATVFVDDLGGAALPAQLAALAPRADPRTGLFEVLFVVDLGSVEGVRAGMVGRVAIGKAAGAALLIPRAALVLDEASPAVFVLDGTRARLRRVRLGAVGVERAEVIDGLKAGELVVVSGLHALTDGARVDPELPPSGPTEGRSALRPDSSGQLDEPSEPIDAGPAERP